MKKLVVLVAHGTVEDLSDLPEFLLRIRRGRPAPVELVKEMEHRYRAVGGSPHLRETQAQAAALGKVLSMDTRAAMRLWSPTVLEMTRDLSSGDEVILVPMAPYSVTVYERAARAELETRSDAPSLRAVEPWGQSDELIEAQVGLIRDALSKLDVSKTEVVLTAHSLPQAVIDAGDQYAVQFERAAERVAAALPAKCTIAYQSQGASGGRWIGPTLLDTMSAARDRGQGHVLVAPMGFLAEHIETLYDLDIEAKAQASELGIGFSRVPTLRTHEGLIQALSGAVHRVL